MAFFWGVAKIKAIVQNSWQTLFQKPYSIDVFNHLKVRLDEIQLQELETLRNELYKEQEVLNTYQAGQSAHLRNHIDKELKALEERVAMRKKLLQDRVSGKLIDGYFL